MALWSTTVPYSVALLVVVAGTAPTRLAGSPTAALPVILIELVLAALCQPNPIVLSGSMLLRLDHPAMVLLAVHRHRHGLPPAQIPRRRRRHRAPGGGALFGGAIRVSPTAASQKLRKRIGGPPDWLLKSSMTPTTIQHSR